MDRRAYELLAGRLLYSDETMQYLTRTQQMTIFVDSQAQDYAHLDSPRQHVLLPFLCFFYGRIPHLRVLDVLGSNLPIHIDPSLLSQFPQLTSLSLHNCRFPSFNVLRRMLSAVPSLTTLRISHMTFTLIGHPWLSIPVKMKGLALRTLHLVGASPAEPDHNHVSDILMQWFTIVCTPSVITELLFQTPAEGREYCQHSYSTLGN